jgi:hypothetical protein
MAAAAQRTHRDAIVVTRQGHHLGQVTHAHVAQPQHALRGSRTRSCLCRRARVPRGHQPARVPALRRRLQPRARGQPLVLLHPQLKLGVVRGQAGRRGLHGTLLLLSALLLLLLALVQLVCAIQPHHLALGARAGCGLRRCGCWWRSTLLRCCCLLVGRQSCSCAGPVRVAITSRSWSGWRGGKQVCEVGGQGEEAARVQVGE